MDFIDERATGTYTNRCSRTDLLEIARLLPQRDTWDSEAFDCQKTTIKSRYGLSNKQFSTALDRIQENREMRSILGMQSDLLHLTDADIVWVVEQWRRLHPPRLKNENDLGLRYLDTERFAAMNERRAISREVLTAIDERVSPEALAELEAMFYLGRDRVFVEYHERMVALTFNEHATVEDTRQTIWHLMAKTNFLTSMLDAVTKLGRLSLVERLKAA